MPTCDYFTSEKSRDHANFIKAKFISGTANNGEFGSNEYTVSSSERRMRHQNVPKFNVSEDKMSNCGFIWNVTGVKLFQSPCLHLYFVPE